MVSGYVLCALACRVFNGNWDRKCGQNFQFYQPSQALKNWCIVFPNTILPKLNKFIKGVIESGQKMGFEISEPHK